jgi:hypothetical protein
VDTRIEAGFVLLADEVDVQSLDPAD